MAKLNLRNLLRQDFRSFLEKAFLQFHEEKLTDESGYIEYMCTVLMGFINRDTKQLLINLPGRHLKTFICSVCVPAFMLGINPKLRFLVVSYDQKNAQDIVELIRTIMNSIWFRAAFNTRIAKHHALKFDIATEQGGRVRAVSVTGATGKGGDIIIFDDPHNALDWDNPARKRKVITAFAHLMTRRNSGPKSSFLAVGHRVAEDDLSAHIIERGGFKHVCLPLFAPKALKFVEGEFELTLAKGQALRPESTTATEIEQLREDEEHGPPFWLHSQQGHGPRGNGRQIRCDHFPIWKRNHDGLPVVISVDPALKTLSQSQNVIHVYGIIGNRYILLQAWASQCNFKKLRLKVEYFIEAYSACRVLVENTARGPDLIDALRKNVDIQIEAINPRKKKEQRLRTCISIIRAKRVWMREGRDEVERAINQVIAFPNTPNDDHVDAMTNFLIWAQKNRHKMSQLEVIARRVLNTGPAIALSSRRAVVSTQDVRGIALARYSAPHPLDESNERSSSRASSYKVQDHSVPVIYGTPAGPVRRRTSS